MHLDTARNQVKSSFMNAFWGRALDQEVVDALEALDFTDEVAVQNLHTHIANTTIIEKICDLLFYKGDLEKCRESYTAMLFLKAAEKRQQPIVHIPRSREEALETMATCMSPAAQEALLAAVEDHEISNEFTKVFDRHDLYYLAAKVLLVQEAALLNPDAEIGPGEMSQSHWKLQKAGEYFASAGLHYSNKANNPSLAIASYQQAQNCYRRQGWLSQIAQNKHAVGCVLVKSGHFSQAADAFKDAAMAYLDTSADYMEHGEKEAHFVRTYARDAATMYKLGAEFLEKDYKYKEAGDYYRECADIYKAIGEQPWDAEENYKKAADCYDKGHAPEKRLMAMEQAQTVRQQGG